MRTDGPGPPFRFAIKATFGMRREESAMNRKLVPHHSHWGAFNAVVEGGKVVGAVPFDFDPDPSPLIEAIPEAVHSPTRAACPMVRAGWLENGRAAAPAAGANRSCRSNGSRPSSSLPASWL